MKKKKTRQNQAAQAELRSGSCHITLSLSCPGRKGKYSLFILFSPDKGGT